MRGLKPKDQAPDWAAQRARRGATAAAQHQRGVGGLAAIPTLVPVGLGKDAHIACASGLTFPYDEQHDEDDDLSFAARAMAIMGPAVRHWREAQAKALKAVAAAVRPLERKLRAVMPQHIAAAPEHKAPAAMAAATVLLR